MIKKPFLLFSTVVAVLVAGAILFIQSRQFAGIVKNVVQKRLPSDLGIQGDFRDFSIRLFPPGISINEPRVTVAKRNILNLPGGSSVTAERIDLDFRPFQMLSGNIRVHEASVINGYVKLILAGSPGPRKKTNPGMRPDIHWDQLLQIRAEALSVQNTRLHLENPDQSFEMDLTAQTLRVGQWSGAGGLGYEIKLDLGEVQSGFLKEWVAPGAIDQLTAEAHVNAMGAQIDSVSLTAKGVQLNGSGTVKGDLLKSGDLTLDAKTELKGDLDGITQILGNRIADKHGDKLDAEGRIAFNGHVRANLSKLSETLHVEGTLRGQDMRYQAWKAAQVGVEAEYYASPSGGEIAVNHVLVTAGGGGKVEIGAFKTPLSFKEKVTVPLAFENAHVHWLGAPVLKQIYPLNFLLNGPISATYSPSVAGTPWNVQAKLAVAATEFQLDNQKLGVTKPLKRILKVPRVQLDGQVTLDSQAVRFAGLNISLPHTKFRTNGKVDFKTGYEIMGTGPVDFTDFGLLAENEIRGVGTLTTHVHGPTSGVLIDFDTELKGAKYLHLDLGDLSGRITWDDDPNHLLFSSIQALKGHTPYTVNGMLDLGAANTINLGIDIGKGNVQDFIQIFSFLTRDLWWFPSSLSGEMEGHASVTGGIELARMNIDSDLRGTNWEYLGERFRTVRLKGGYDRGKYQVTDFASLKQTGKLTGRISFDQDHRFDWDFHSKDFMVTDLDHLARMDVPFRGTIKFDSTGSGREGNIKSSSDAVLSDFAVRGSGMASSAAYVKTEAGVATIHVSALGGQGIFDLAYNSNHGSESVLRTEAHRLDFSPMLLLVNSRLMQDPALTGKVSGLMQLRFQSGELEHATGKIAIDEYRLSKTGAHFDLESPVSFGVNEGIFNFKDLAIRGETGRTTLAMEGTKAGIEGTVSGDLDISIAEFFTSSIVRSSGNAALDFIIAGTLKEPRVFGKATLDGASLKIPSLESPFENITGTFQFKQNLLSVQNLESDLAGGRVTADGVLELFANRYPAINLRGSLAGNRLKVYPFQFVKVHGNVSVKGTEKPYQVSGVVAVDSALSTERILNQQNQGEGLKAMQYTPPPTTQRQSDSPLFRLNIEAAADHGILVKNDLFDAELKGNVTIVNTLETPRILGSAELVQGEMVFKDRKFHILSASAKFDNPTVIDPSFDLTSVADVNNSKIQLYATGHLSKYKLDLSSTPVMAESEILSLLALGVTSNDTKRLNNSDLQALQQGEAASLLLNSLGFNGDVQDKTGFQLQVDESINTQLGQSIFQPQSVATSAASPRIVIKRQLGSNLGISYGSTVGVGTYKQNEANIEYHLTPSISVLGVWDYYYYETPGTTENQTSMGGDLKFQQRFH